MRDRLLCGVAVIERPAAGDYTAVMRPEELHRLGHSWSTIRRWALENPVRWDPGERDRLIAEETAHG